MPLCLSKQCFPPNSFHKIFTSAASYLGEEHYCLSTSSAVGGMTPPPQFFFSSRIFFTLVPPHILLFLFLWFLDVKSTIPKWIVFHHVSGKNPLVFLTFSRCECGAKYFWCKSQAWGGGGGYLPLHFILMVKWNASKNLKPLCFHIRYVACICQNVN